MATLHLNELGPLDHTHLLSGAVRLAMALGATYHDLQGHLLVSEHEVLAALARDGSVIPTRADTHERS